MCECRPEIGYVCGYHEEQRRRRDEFWHDLMRDIEHTRSTGEVNRPGADQ